MEDLIVLILFVAFVWQYFRIRDLKWWVNYYRNDSDRQHNYFLDMFDAAQRWRKKFAKLKNKIAK